MHPDSVGYPYPNQQLRFVDGELWLKGENIMLGYIGEQEESFTPDGWFCTGDLAHLDENGLLYITGRIKEIIVLSNGENVSPAEVEFHFNEPSSHIHSYDVTYIAVEYSFALGQTSVTIVNRPSQLVIVDCLHYSVALPKHSRTIRQLPTFTCVRIEFFLK